MDGEKAVESPGRSSTRRLERQREWESNKKHEKGRRREGERETGRRRTGCVVHMQPRKGQKKGGGERGRVACAHAHTTLASLSPPGCIRMCVRATKCTVETSREVPAGVGASRARSWPPAPPPGATNPAALPGPPSANRASDGDAARMKKCPFRPGGRAGGLPA